MMLGSDGFEVFGLAMDGPFEKSIEAIQGSIDFVGKSKLFMTIPTMPEVY